MRQHLPLTAWHGRLLALLLLAVLAPAWAQLDGGVAIGGGVVRFATLAQGQAELGRSDEWTATAGEFHRSSLLGRSSGVSADELRAALPRAALAWTREEEQRWRTALYAIVARVDALRVKVPPAVLLVLTDGTDSAGAPYTRGNAIFLPRGRQQGAPADPFIMAHELFHVISRNDPELATRVYGAFGFEPVGELEWPPEWGAARLSNPDAPHHRHAVRIEVDGKPVPVMPVLVATRTTLNPGESFFNVLEVRLVAIEPTVPTGRSQAMRRNGEPAWYPVGTLAYLQRMGGNTPYIIHPEETAADHFAYLVSGRQVRNPALLQRFEALLTGTPTPTTRP